MSQPKEGTSSQEQILEVLHTRLTKDLYGMGSQGAGYGKSFLSNISKADKPKRGSKSNTDPHLGIRFRPFNMGFARSLRHSNEYHTACLQATVQSVVGLGHITEQVREERRARIEGRPPKFFSSSQMTSKVDETLNPLCMTTWQASLSDCAFDMFELGNMYLEVVKRGGDVVTGLHHLPAEHMYVETEAEGNFHYVFNPSYMSSYEEYNGQEKKFARFGDKESFMDRMGKDLEDDEVSEVIHIKCPSGMSRYYGVPWYLSCVASIELYQMITQEAFDYHLNRGVPEFILSVIGEGFSPEQIKEIKQAMKAHIGLGNSRKSMFLHAPVNPESVEIDVKPLAMESDQSNDFAPKRENLASSVVSAWRVPPVLAGIQTPGKLGATNELPNAIKAYQALVVGPSQRHIQQCLGSTLGNNDLSGLGLTMDDFELQTLLDYVNVSEMDTVARMRQTPDQAAAEGRDLNDGVKS